ncbi:MAG: hypothetical protein ACUVRD_00360 [Bacteroidia bacterium]
MWLGILLAQVTLIPEGGMGVGAFISLPGEGESPITTPKPNLAAFAGFHMGFQARPRARLEIGTGIIYRSHRIDSLPARFFHLYTPLTWRLTFHKDSTKSEKILRLGLYSTLLLSVHNRPPIQTGTNYGYRDYFARSALGLQIGSGWHKNGREIGAYLSWEITPFQDKILFRSRKRLWHASFLGIYLRPWTFGIK